MSARRKFWFPFVAVVLVICAIVFSPYQSTTSPQWLIQVVDESGKPVPNLQINEEWSYFGIDMAPWLDNRQTDFQGRASFPRRVIWASFASRLLNYQGASERLGPSVWILACDETQLMKGEVFWEGKRFQFGGPQSTEVRIVVKAVEHCPMM
jgi:hypothetical protein